MKTSKRYLAYPKPTYALLSIKPNFAEAILRGEKKYEFRRSIFTRPVDIVLLYASAPVQRVLAEFDVRSIVTESVETLWELTKRSAGIGEDLFYRYFAGRDYGHAIEIGEVRPYKIPFCPVEYLGIRPPQSFAYVNSCFVFQSNYRSVRMVTERSDSPLFPGIGDFLGISNRTEE